MSLFLFSTFIIFCIIFSLLEILSQKSLIFLDIILVLFFILLIAYRSIYDTPDTLTYVYDFDSVGTDYLYFPGTINTLYQFEYGYTLVSQLFKMLFGNRVAMFFGLLACINLIIALVSSKNILKHKIIVENPSSVSTEIEGTNSQHKKIILFAPLFSLYVSYFGFMYSGIVLRQGLAISISLIAFYFLNNKKYFWGLLFLFISFFFHYTAVFSVGILFFAFTEFTFKKATYSKFLSIVFLLYLFKRFNVISIIVSNFLFDTFYSGFIGISSDKINTYLGNATGNLSEYSLSIIANFIFSFFAILLSDNTDKFQHKLLQINIFAISLLSFLAGIQALTRVMDYYLIFNILLFYTVLFNKKVTMMKLAFFSLIIVSNSIAFYRLAIL
jgi:hypothetical protein